MSRTVVRSASSLVALVASLVIASCSERPLTQLVVVVDTDLTVPAQLDAVEIVITDPQGATQRSSGSLSGDGARELPATLGVVHRGGALGPVDVVARGLRGGTEVVQRHAQAFLVEGRTLVLEVHLERACVGVLCENEQTCAHGECRAVLVDATELRPYDGTIPRVDRRDGGDDCLAAELCNTIDDDCDGAADEGIDLEGDPRNCGACGVVCPTFASAVPACVAGECTIACTEGRGDCDGEARTGCETPLDSLTMCHECGQECVVEHGTPSCFGAECQVLECAPGFGDCDDAVATGCEQRLDGVAHCGACDVPCARDHATPTCAGGACRVAACDEGWASCDDEDANGCERSVSTATDCGGCDVACPAPANGTAICVDGRCGARCATGWGDCNGMASDGCETPLDTLADCGACGRACALSHASETCDAGTCALAACDAGWGDCDLSDDTGCEASLETAMRCGACDVSCGGATPLCSVVSGNRTCRSACGTGLTLCGSECAALSTSLEHCGACDRACAPAHASGICSAGTCGIAQCDPGWGDCNGRATDGCETPLDTLADCGECDATCALPGASESCASGRCAIATCDAGRGDCDGVTANGCETATNTLADCGGCGVACDLANAGESCATGTCTLGACAPGWADCDGMPITGCERRIDTVSDCGSCGASCDLPRATDRCTGGSCAIASCDPEWGDCDGVASNGCEESLRTVTDCGGCDTACGPFANASAGCASGTCEMTCNALWGDCSTTLAGCDTRLDTLLNCGACRSECRVGSDARPTCATGTCAIASCTRADRGDCNGSIDDGCEAHLNDDRNHCGGCGIRCTGGTRCRDSRCR